MMQYAPFAIAIAGAYLLALCLYFALTISLGSISADLLVHDGKIASAYLPLSSFFWIAATAAGGFLSVAVAPAAHQVILGTFVALLLASIAICHLQQRPAQGALLSLTWCVGVLLGALIVVYASGSV